MTGSRLLLLLLLFFWPAALPAAPSPQEKTALAGTVLDVSGAPVPGASVRLEVDGLHLSDTVTDDAGRFSVAGVPGGRLLVRAAAPGFTPAEETLTVPAGDGELRVALVLAPSPFRDIVVVTASRGAGRGPASASSATVLAAADLLSLGAATLDDALRAVPGFTLFRRTSSRAANPTAQGASLRGLGASGASRTLVLADGVPLNDPFGGWVYWNRIPHVAIDRVEVVRGGSSELYGTDALGGVIQVLTLRPDRAALRGAVEHGSRTTNRVSAFGSGRAAGWTGLGAGEWSASDGYRIVAPAERGTVDTPAAVDYRTALLGGGFQATAWRAGLRANLFAEDRRNGTPLQINDTRLAQVTAEAGGLGAGGSWSARIFAGTQDYHQTFSAIEAGRTSERLTREQWVPSRSAGLAAEWIQPWRGHYALAGLEVRRVEATNEEQGFGAADQPLPRSTDGGDQRAVSMFAQARAAPAPRLMLVAGLRGEIWRTSRAGTASNRGPAGFVAPRASAAWQVSPSLTLRGAVHRSFRTPTLNELYRGFRVGNVVTEANPELGPETATGLEGGVLLSGRSHSTRVVAYWTHLSNPIANVTVSAAPELILRQRRNAGSTRGAGLELESDVRLHRSLSLTASAGLARSRFHRSPEPGLAGNLVPQIARYQLSAGLRYADPSRLTCSAQIRITGPQWEDDRNTLELRRAATLDLYASRGLRAGVHAFAAVENLFDAEVDVGRTPVRTIGVPRTVRAGLRVFVP